MGAASPAQLVRWTEAEQEDEQRITAQRLAARQESERKEALLRADPGAIRQWLVLAPIPLDASVALPTRREALVLDTPQHPQEAELRPRMGEAFRIGARELYWTAVAFEDYPIDFNELLGETTDAIPYAERCHSPNPEGCARVAGGHGGAKTPEPRRACGGILEGHQPCATPP